MFPGDQYHRPSCMRCRSDEVNSRFFANVFNIKQNYECFMNTTVHTYIQPVPYSEGSLSIYTAGSCSVLMGSFPNIGKNWMYKLLLLYQVPFFVTQ